MPTDNLFDHIKYYSKPTEEKIQLIGTGQYLNIFKNDPDPAMRDLAVMVLEHVETPGAMLPIHFTLSDERYAAIYPNHLK